MDRIGQYFSIYPNNLFLVFIFSSILKLNMVLGEPISNGGMLLAMVQCLLINVTGVLVYKCARNYAGIAASWGIYLFYAILIGTSGWIVLPYSDGMGSFICCWSGGISCEAFYGHCADRCYAD